jgi:3-oxoacyl-[acyl-carrier-protein] synthase-3
MLHLISVASTHPENILTNQFIEDLDIGTNSQWIDEKIGVSERVTSLPVEYIRSTRNADPREARKVRLDSSSTFAVVAAEKALRMAGITAADVGMILSNCCTPDSGTPGEAQRLAATIGAEQAEAYDVMTACPAFALHVDFLNKFREEDLPDYVLCVATATLTQKVNYNERSDSAIWGDGAAAWIISPRHPGKLKVVYTSYTSDPLRCDAVVVDAFGHFHQDGRAVRDFSVRQTVRLIKSIESKFDINWERDVFIGHQANRTMLEQICNNRKIPSSSHWHNVTFIGNQAAAGAPATLADHWNDISSGQKIVVAVVGAGLSWGSVLLEAV